MCGVLCVCGVCVVCLVCVCVCVVCLVCVCVRGVCVCGVRVCLCVSVLLVHMPQSSCLFDTIFARDTYSRTECYT